MEKTNKQKGDIGENIAIKYLENKNLKVIEKQYRKRFGEIDIICMDNDTIVFVEVKLRKSNALGHPLESITKSKIEKIYKVADSYLRENELIDNLIRFDVVSIMLENNLYNVEHIKNAF